ncbi:hypothetical protein ACFVUS_07020 [Nocardia sp. NPDC058058]|uniref:hypothetical protein n=1 Tax=Nocardia sp. NPDC058058 TaxID=3346317 RepID=UPI0036DA80EA
MTAALLAAAAGVFGIVVGRLWDSRSESARWRRDQKTASYQRFAAQFEAMYEAIRIIALTDVGSGSLPSVVQDARTGNFIPWDSALSAVWLHGSCDVVSGATLVDREILGLFHEATGRLFTVEEWNEARRPARQAFENFIGAARTELDLPQVPMTLFPESAPPLPVSRRWWGLR